MIVIAIDPGAQGSFAIWDGETTLIEEMPSCEDAIRDRVKGYYLRYNGLKIHVYIELFSGFFGGEGQAVQGMAKLTANAAFIRGAFSMITKSIVKVPPRVWQNQLPIEKKRTAARDLSKGERQRLNGIYKREWKNRLKDYAQSLYPEFKVTLENADALLLLRYGLRECGIDA